MIFQGIYSRQLVHNKLNSRLDRQCLYPTVVKSKKYSNLKAYNLIYSFKTIRRCQFKDITCEIVCEVTPPEITKKIVKAWVNKFIIGENVCPFAAESMRHTHIKVCADEASRSLEAAVAAEIDFLLAQPTHRGATTLLALTGPWAAGDFESFMTLAVPRAVGVLEQLGKQKAMQIVPFHPEADFSDIDNDPACFVARSPVPLLHLLRQSDVERAEEVLLTLNKHPGDVAEENTARMHGLGHNYLTKLMGDIHSLL